MERQTTGVRERTSEFAAPGLAVCFVQTIGHCYCASARRRSPIQKINCRYLSKLCHPERSDGFAGRSRRAVEGPLRPSDTSRYLRATNPSNFIEQRRHCGTARGPSTSPSHSQANGMVPLRMTLEGRAGTDGPDLQSCAPPGWGARPYVFFVKKKGRPWAALFQQIESYDVTPAPAWGVAAAAVAAAASFRMRWWMVNNANSSRSETPILSYTLRR